MFSLLKVEKISFLFVIIFKIFQNFSLIRYFFYIIFDFRNLFEVTKDSFCITKIIKEFFRRFLREEVVFFSNKISKKLVKNSYTRLELDIKLLIKLKKKRQFGDIKKIFHFLDFSTLKKFLVKSYSSLNLILNCSMKKFSLLKKIYINYQKNNNKKQLILPSQKFRNRIGFLKFLN